MKPTFTLLLLLSMSCAAFSQKLLPNDTCWTATLNDPNHTYDWGAKTLGDSGK